MGLLTRKSISKPAQQPGVTEAPSATSNKKPSIFGSKSGKAAVVEENSEEETAVAQKVPTRSLLSKSSKSVEVQKGKAPPVPGKDKITVRIHELELFGTKNGNALVEVDMLDTEKKPTRTPSQVLVRGKTDFKDFQKKFDASEGTALHSAITNAFTSDGDEDEGQVEFVVFTTEAQGGKEVEVGMAVLSLEAVLDDMKDHSGTLQILNDENKPVGKLTCEVTALAVLQQIDAMTDESKSIRVQAGQLRLVDGARTKKEAAQPVRLTVGLFGEKDVLSKPVAPDQGSNSCDLDFTAAFPVVTGGPLAQRLQSALRGPSDSAEGRVHLRLDTVAAKGSATPLGEASISLLELLKGGRDTRSVSLVLHKPAAKGGVLSRGKATAASQVEVATLTVSVTAVELLRELDRTAAPAVAAPAAARSRSATPPPVAREGSRRSRGAAVSEAAVQVSVASFAFSKGAPARELVTTQKIRELWVVATAAGDAEAETSRQRVDEFRCEFGDDRATLAFGIGSAFRKALETALHSGLAHDGAQLRLTLKGKGSRKEHTLGTATVDLLELLDDGHDLRAAELTLNEGREEVGTLTCSITALAALQELEKQAAAGTGVAAAAPVAAPAAAAESGVHRRRRAAAQASESIGVKLTRLEISVNAAKYLTAQVEVDMLDTEKEPSRTAPKALADGRVHQLDFEQQYDASAGSALRKAIAAAFESERQDDSEIQFVVSAVEAQGGKEVEVGMAVLSLEAVLDDMKDHSGTLQILNDENKPVGKLTCEVTALAALQAAEDGKPEPQASTRRVAAPAAAERARAAEERAVVERSRGAPKARQEAEKPAEVRRGAGRRAQAADGPEPRQTSRGSSEGASATARIKVSATKFTLDKSVKLKRGEALSLSVDVLGAATSKTRPTEAKRGEHAFDLEWEEAAPAGSELAVALEEVLRSMSEDDVDVVFTVVVCDKKGVVLRQLGAARVPLDGVLAQGKDAPHGPRVVKSLDGGEVGRLSCSVRAFEALQEIEETASEAARGGGVKGRGGGLAASRAAGRSGARPESGKGDHVMVRLTSVQLAKDLKLGKRMESLVVEVDMLESEKKPARPVATLKSGLANFDFEQQYDASAGSALRKAIAAAFESERQDDSEIQFVVSAVEAQGGKEVEVGMAVLSLEAVLDDMKDHSGTLQILNDENKPVGKLTCEVTALAVLQQIDEASSPAQVALEVTQLKVNATGLKMHKLRGGAAYFVEIDLLGVDALVERTKRETASAQNACTFRYARSHDAGPGSALQSAIQQALRSEGDEDDSEVQFIVYAVGANGGEVEVGMAVVSLEALLDDEKDHALAPVSVMRNNIEVARLTVAVKALAALRAITEQARGGAPLVVQVSALHLLHSEPRDAWVEIDVPGEPERETPRQQPRSGACEFGWRHDYPAGAGTPVHTSLLSALAGGAPEEGELIFRAYQADASGRRSGSAVGVARCNLEEMILRRGAELVNRKLELLDTRGLQVGTVTVSVTALAALQQVDDEAVAAGRISVKLTKLELTSKAKTKLRRQGGGVGVLVDMLGVEDTAMAARDGTTLTFTKDYNVSPGSELRKAIEEAFRSPSEADSEVQFAVVVEDTARQKNEVGLARLSLETLLSKGKDHMPTAPLDVTEVGAQGGARPPVIGQLTCEVRAVSALRAIDAALKGGKSAKKTGAQLAMSQREREREAAAAAARRKISLKVGDVALSGRVARRPPDSLHLAIEFPRMAEVRTHALSPSSGGRLDFNYHEEYELSVGSAARDAVMDALASDRHSDSFVHLSLFGTDGRAAAAQETYMGGAHFSLHDILRTKENLKDTRLDVRAEPIGGSGSAAGLEADRLVGSVSVSCTALDALRDVQAALTKFGSTADAKIGEMQEMQEQSLRDAAPAGAPDTAGGDKGAGPPWARAHADDQLVVRLRDLTVEKAAWREAIGDISRKEKATVETVVIELDVLGIAEPPKPGGAQSVQILTPPLAVYSDGKVEKLEYERRLSTAPGTRARAKMMEALESDETQDSDVFFVLHGLVRPLHASRAGGRAGEERKVELATGFVNLEEILRQTKQDTQNEMIPLKAPDGSEKVVASVRVDVEALAALRRVDEQRQATRLVLQVHKLQLAKETLARAKGDALQLGVTLLGLAEQKSPAVDFYPKEATYDFKGWSFVQPAHHGAEGRAELLAQLGRTPSTEQLVTVTLYDVDSRRTSARAAELASLVLPLGELRRGHEPQHEKRALDAAGDAHAGSRRGGLKDTAPGHVWLTVRAADALHWLQAESKAVGPSGAATSAAERREYKGKQHGLEGVWVERKRVEASPAVRRGWAAIRSTISRSVSDYAQALGARPISYAPSLLAARQHLHLSMLCTAVAQQLPPPLVLSAPPPAARGTLAAQPTYQPSALPQSAQPSFAVELGDVLHAPPPPGPSHPVARRTVRLCVVEHDAAAYTFRGNVLTLAVDYDPRDNVWRLHAAGRQLLMRTQSPPAKHAVLLIELVLTMASTGSDSGAAQDVLVCAWAALPLAEPLAAAAAAAGGSHKALAAPTPLRLQGGSLFAPKQLHSLRGAAAAADLANPPVLSCQIVPLAREHLATAALLPSELLAPVEHAAMLLGCRQLCLEYTIRLAGGGVEGGGALGSSEVQAALSAFALLSETPDGLSALHRVVASRREAWGAQVRGSRRGTDPTPSELASMLAEVVRSAHVLGRGSTLSLPPFDSADPSHSEARLLSLQRFADRTSQDPVAMLCEDDPFLSYAPLRTMDLQVDAF